MLQVETFSWFHQLFSPKLVLQFTQLHDDKFVLAKNFDNLDKEVLEIDAEDNESVELFTNLAICTAVLRQILKAEGLWLVF